MLKDFPARFTKLETNDSDPELTSPSTALPSFKKNLND